MVYIINRSGYSTEASTVNIRCHAVSIKAFPPDLFFVDIGFLQKKQAFNTTSHDFEV